MKISTVTVFLSHDDAGRLYSECRRPANLELFAELEKILSKYPAHRVVLTVNHGLCMNMRKTISGMDEFRRCFATMGDKWVLEEQPKYRHDSRVTALVVSSDG
ncbi:hypothetical protein DICSQDRAFT_174064 [Dichomitus squalens LYAD-421 SS1]|uniref:Uncharacterized protein n=1 Tax=Dichomitus squalens (strain LYAD-421) TaxID=732165 RepID=R7SME2_DICSQ|nr:uncharacterized protein DICSQDRAFT_174064 [Dichomitus squalens LYAD-421 SS1]EJF57301.1 hypothetical protein DICSQDRAFT_174064 [Dichomitus squalens LYAD-421 SS1]